MITCKHDECGDKFTSESAHKVHYNNIHLGITYTCTEGCGSIYKSMSDMKRHIKRKHLGIPVVSKKIKCPECDNVFSSKTLHTSLLYSSWKLIGHLQYL